MKIFNQQNTFNAINKNRQIRNIYKLSIRSAIQNLSYKNTTQMNTLIVQKDQIAQPKEMININQEQESSSDLQDISFMIFKPNKQKSSLKNLISLKQLFVKCLPKMSKLHILRTILDQNHLNLVMIREKRQLVGATTFRIFESNDFSEIVFFAIKEKYQGIGLGAILMEALKNEMQKIEIRNLLTYADDLAHKFFHKQGFSYNITLQANKYQGLIKKYEGGTLMHCFIEDDIEESDDVDVDELKIIEQNHSKCKIVSQNLLKSQKIQKVESRIKILKKQKMEVEEQVQDENSLMKWLRKAEKMDSEKPNNN